MKKRKNNVNTSFLTALALFILGMMCLCYIVYFIGRTMSNELLPPSFPVYGEIPTFSATPPPLPASAKECQKGNIISCAKEAFGWDKK
jgi:hypothetical protein